MSSCRGRKKRPTARFCDADMARYGFGQKNALRAVLGGFGRVANERAGCRKKRSAESCLFCLVPNGVLTALAAACVQRKSATEGEGFAQALRSLSRPENNRRAAARGLGGGWMSVVERRVLVTAGGFYAPPRRAAARGGLDKGQREAMTSRMRIKKRLKED